MDRNDRTRCTDCDSEFNRRQFIATAAGAAAAASLPLAGNVLAAPMPGSSAETAVRRFYDTLTDAQKKDMALPLDDSRRQRISANWRITKSAVGSFSKEQQAIIDDIFKGLTSEDGYERFLKQMDDDAGGFGEYTVAIFGNPHEKEFEFELTGRHHTIRADGNTLAGMAFGGPIVYGHAADGNSSENLFSYQTKRANEVFAALDGKQREQALLAKAPKESAVRLRDDLNALPGVACGDLSQDQQGLVSAVLADIMQPYRKEDVDEVMEIVKGGGGMEKVRIAFYKQGDIDNDKSWDIWRLEGPTLVCHFRGAPHVHAYINVAKRA